MKFIFMSLLSFFAIQFAHADPTEKEIFSCQSQVQGFENFRVIQIDDTVDNQPKTTYQLKTGIIFFEEVWDQYGDAKIAQESPVFQSEFSRKYTPPILPIPPDQPQPEPELQEYFMNVSINVTGTGSVSVNGDLAPISCTRNP